MPEIIRIPIADGEGQYVYFVSADSSSRGGLAAGELANALDATASQFRNAVGSVVKLIRDAVSTIESPDKVTVEMGLDVSYGAGQMLSVIVRGQASASLKLTMEWAKSGS
jgi:hypothetical protein